MDSSILSLYCQTNQIHTQDQKENPELLETINEEHLLIVPIDSISINPNQPRKIFDDAELEELAESIKSVGLLHPPLVRPLPNPQSFELISGERRLRACQLANLTAIPVVIRETSATISAHAALIENIQRVDLNPLEIAKALKNLIDSFGYNHETLAKHIGKKRSTVANYLRLLNLPKNIQDSLNKQLITMGHAKALLSLCDSSKQQLLHDLILRDDLSVRQAEETALRFSNREKKPRLYFQNRDFILEQLAEKVQQTLGTKVAIQGKGKKGRILIDYYNFDDLDRILEILGVPSF